MRTANINCLTAFNFTLRDYVLLIGWKEVGKYRCNTNFPMFDTYVSNVWQTLFDSLHYNIRGLEVLEQLDIIWLNHTSKCISIGTIIYMWYE